MSKNNETDFMRTGIIKNYDPARLFPYKHKYVDVAVYQNDEIVFQFAMPESDLCESKEKNESKILYFYRIYRWAENFIQDDRLKKPKSLEIIANAITEVTSYYIASNVLFVLLEKAQNDPSIDSIYFGDESEPEPTSPSEELEVMCREFLAYITPIVRKTADKCKEEAAIIINHEAFASARWDLDKKFTSSQVEAMSNEDFEKSFYELLFKEERFGECISSYCQPLARIGLEALNPAEKTIDELSLWFKAKIIKGNDGGNQGHLPQAEIIIAEMEQEPSPDEWKKILVGLFKEIGLMKAPEAFRILSTEPGIRFEYLGMDGSECTITYKGKQPQQDFQEFRKSLEGKSRERERRHDDSEFITAAYHSGRKGRDLTKRNLCEIVGCSESTLDNHISDNQNLWKLCKENHLTGKKEFIANKLV